MKYRVMAAVILIWITAFCQSTLLEYLEIFNIRPNILIVLMVIVALPEVQRRVLLWGFVFTMIF